MSSPLGSVDSDTIEFLMSLKFISLKYMKYMVEFDKGKFDNKRLFI